MSECGSSSCSTACDFASSSSDSVTFNQISVAVAVLLRDENCCSPESSSSCVPPSPASSSSSPSSGSCVGGGGGGLHQPEMRVSVRFLEIQREKCRLLRCTECCFCGGQFSEAPVQQEPEPDSNGSEVEQQMDKNAGWDEGTCAQCGACYVRSIIRPVLCQCGAELCGYSFRCLFAHAKRCAAATNAQATYE